MVLSDVSTGVYGLQQGFVGLWFHRLTAEAPGCRACLDFEAQCKGLLKG